MAWPDVSELDPTDPDEVGLLSIETECPWPATGLAMMSTIVVMLLLLLTLPLNEIGAKYRDNRRENDDSPA